MNSSHSDECSVSSAASDELFDLLASGCLIVDDGLGFQSMPDGYHILVNPDQTHFFWFEIKTGRQGVEHWDKWAVRRGAKLDLATNTSEESGDE